MTTDNHYDAIIIGSGIGGLTLGAILSKLNNKRILILEKHFTAGGQTHDFKRKNYTWDTGLHYVGEIEKGSLSRKFFNYITNSKLNWKSLPDYFEIFHYPDMIFKVSKDKKNYRQDLISRFPDEKKAINRYFKDVKKAAFWNQRYFFTKILPYYLSWIFKSINYCSNYHKITASDYFKKYFKDKKLISVLSSQWISYMMPPNEASFLCHSVIVSHYMKGGFYPEGGSKKIAETIIPLIEKRGGKVLLSRNVRDIIVKNNKAEGVIAEIKNKNGDKTTEEYYAPVIISNTGILNSYQDFLKQYTKEKTFKDINDFPEGYSCLSLYLGFKSDPKKLGFSGANEWMYDSYDHNKIFKEAYKIIKNKPNHCVISFPSMKNNLKDNIYTGEILYYLDYSYFAKWKNKSWLKRDKDYYKLKETIAKKLIEKVNIKYPGFKDIVDYYELSTPLSMEYFTNRNKGVYNGMPLIPLKYLKNWVKIKTPLKNFLLTGSDLNFFGIIGGMMGGIATASYLNGVFGFFKILFKAFRKNTK